MGLGWSGWIVFRRLRALADATGRPRRAIWRRAPRTGRDEVGALERDLNGMAARLSAMMIAEREARHSLEGRGRAGRERTREVELLRQLTELLQACATPDEAHGVMGQLCGRLVSGRGRGGPGHAPLRDGLWLVAAWGPPLGGGRERFQLDDCWALRRAACIASTTPT